jgi:hypothetical protein
VSGPGEQATRATGHGHGHGDGGRRHEHANGGDANGETEGEMPARRIPDTLHLLGPRYGRTGLGLAHVLHVSMCDESKGVTKRNNRATERETELKV